ncbi:MAG: hypothetical protein K5654_01065 [Lachnospiraceae bacterium]|nr:hypothetical protein [Lachnospiraceae bacterium]
MSVKKYYYLSEIFNSIMIFVFILSLEWVARLTIKSYPTVLSACLLFAVILYSFLIRLTRLHLIVYTIIHLITLGIYLFIPLPFEEKVIAGFLFLVFAALNIRHKALDSEDGFADIPIFFVVVPVIGYVVTEILDLAKLSTLFFILGMIYFIAFYLRLFFTGAFLIAVEKEKDDKMPYRDIIKSGSRMAFIFIVISAVVMILVKVDVLDPILIQASLYCIKGITWVIYGIIYAYLLLMNFIGQSSDGVGTDNLMNQFMYEKKSNPIVDVISAVVYVLALAFIIFLFVKFVISIIKFFLMKREHAGLEVEVNDMVEVRENIKIEITRNSEKLGKIRKKYKKYVEKKAKKGYELKLFHTPREREEDMRNKYSEDMHELNVLYEKARYTRDCE